MKPSTRQELIEVAACDLPPEFDPSANPIICRHWFGVEIKTITHTIEAECIGVDKETA